MTTVDPAALSDAALCEQHPAASAAMPDLRCGGMDTVGGEWEWCATPAEWHLAHWRGDYCTVHAARRLRAFPIFSLTGQDHEGN